MHTIFETILQIFERNDFPLGGAQQIHSGFMRPIMIKLKILLQVIMDETLFLPLGFPLKLYIYSIFMLIFFLSFLIHYLFCVGISPPPNSF